MVVGVFWLFRQGKLPFIGGGGAKAGDGGAGSGATAPQPNMETPPASDVDPKY